MSYCDGLTGSPGNGTRFAFFNELLIDCALSLSQNHTNKYKYHTVPVIVRLHVQFIMDISEQGKYH